MMDWIAAVCIIGSFLIGAGTVLLSFCVARNIRIVQIDIPHWPKAKGVNVYELRKAILRHFRRFIDVPMRPNDLKAISTEAAIIYAMENDIVEQCVELKLYGFLAPIPGFEGEYLKITETGAQQLDIEFSQNPFIWGPGAKK